MPEQDRLRSKIGGLPWGLREELWPTCCGRPQKLLAQICHEPPLIDLGEEGAVLHLFQCQECGGIGSDRGRAAFIVDIKGLGSGLTRIDGWDYKPELGERLVGEFFLEGWEEKDDGIPESRLPEFFVEQRLWELQDEYKSIEWFDGREMTRFGGTPRWTGNGPMGFPPPPFEFLFQMNNDLYIEGDPPLPEEVGCEVYTFANSCMAKPPERARWLNAPWLITYESGQPHYCAEYTNLGTDGVIYVFIDRSQRPAAVRWFWNR